MAIYIVFEYSLLPDYLLCFILRFELFKITLLVYLPKRPLLLLLLLLLYASVLFKWVQGENSKRQELLHDLQTATKQNLTTIIIVHNNSISIKIDAECKPIHPQESI